ncbi:sedoheptulose 7-phosphate cyclase [Xenorhabdus bovienii]|uniref:Sedoheptulose 7-phosphate cyclase n=1 Tax=Xenorhabdus bovienii TaxID=40576 RepID=A0AAJ1MYI0_XENBV|nr:sedoheptulose 7-phosphate cyclase [Xenorhabdus bovienii]MDE1477895.1 sedoheptulose 7-phosphate cyclase [Xenorhabdus bovienii]MDE1495190.1 sedoheptulose 7-phosphate cyclase [Xenorhabdus bovienii]MDE9473274.1 sedoheptulose 7-phosphate cyclase [Xenorhabdus bovienii]MDE9509569.1 sedoheptulose 7-phosphate cyclase [Xenorhabdus bovienii]MDE9521212.1 sedoheptulose 7-phosphate cyclase [Xenorhabdus bovienii]
MENTNTSNKKIHSTQWSIKASLPVNYTVEVIQGLFDPNNSHLYHICKNLKEENSRVIVFVDNNVDAHYGDTIKNYFNKYKIRFVWYPIRGDEEAKNIDSVLTVAKQISDSGLLRRSEKIIVIGGGVVMDVVGFTANLYRRGIPYIRIPTTLMGQVDAGIGVKTGINYMEHKNRLGTYFSPEATLIDPEFLKTVSQRHITNGVSEIIKMALIKDAQLFNLLEQAIDDLTPQGFASYGPVHQEIVERAIDGMLQELEPNLWEDNLERIVDYGHTFSPSLELKSNPPLLHGEAVAVDMALCIALSFSRGLITKRDADRCVRLIQRSSLPIYNSVFTLSMLEKALNDTIKHRDGFQRVPLMSAIGSAIFCNDLTSSDLDYALKYINIFNNLGEGIVSHVHE